jgi:hypothetical protein
MRVGRFAVALIALAMTFPAFAVTLLSNLANPANGGYGGSPDAAQQIVTGSQPLVVSSIVVDWAAGNGGVNSVAIYADNAGLPSTTQVGSTFANAGATASGQMTYTGSANLAANTPYWVVVITGDNSNVLFTRTSTYVSDPSTGGAVISVGSAYGDHATGTWAADAADLMIAVAGTGGSATAVPTMSQWVLIALSMLTVAIGMGALRKRRS